ENVLDADHPYVAQVLETMARLHYLTGNLDEALKLAQRAQKIRAAKQIAFGPVAKAAEPVDTVP
ncbi:MAG: tetratricopeptide repeat protein, partial [Planctomycetota bacterium]